MKTIILPGYSTRNKDWAEEMKKKMDLDQEVLVHEWQHWTEGNFSFKQELEKILEEIGEGKVNILAKSVGTRVAMLLFQKIPGQINKVVLCGIPTRGKAKDTVDLYTRGLSSLDPRQIICFQNISDPLAPFKDIETFVHSIEKRIKVVEKPRKDHHYPYPDDFRGFIA